MIESQITPELIELQMRTLNKATDAVRELFKRRGEGPGFPSEWRAREGEAGEVATLHARYADLAIVGQADPMPRGWAQRGSSGAHRPGRRPPGARRALCGQF